MKLGSCEREGVVRAEICVNDEAEIELMRTKLIPLLRLGAARKTAESSHSVVNVKVIVRVVGKLGYVLCVRESVEREIVIRERKLRRTDDRQRLLAVRYRHEEGVLVVSRFLRLVVEKICVLYVAAV